MYISSFSNLPAYTRVLPSHKMITCCQPFKQCDPYGRCFDHSSLPTAVSFHFSNQCSNVHDRINQKCPVNNSLRHHAAPRDLRTYLLYYPSAESIFNIARHLADHLEQSLSPLHRSCLSHVSRTKVSVILFKAVLGRAAST